MADDDDLTGIIPDPPPPNGDRRSEAIGAALRRFDARVGGREEEAPKKAPARRQLAVLASAMLVLLVTVPVLLTQGDNLGRVEVPAETISEPSPAANRPPPALARSEGQSAPVADAKAVTATLEPMPSTDAREYASGVLAPAAKPSGQRPRLRDAVPIAASDSFAGAASAERRVAEEPAAPPPRMALAPPPSPPPPPVAQEATPAEAADAASNIVVTGSRVSTSQVERADSRPPRSRPSSRQLRRWRACTLLDSRKDAARCGADGAPGSAELMRGLDLAFRREDAAALRAFDAAIMQAPQAIGGYLNRSLLYRRKGDRHSALGDVNGAIRVAPGDSRGYYFRSLLLREAGNVASADRDLQTALRLNSP